MSVDSKIREEVTITWRIENYSYCYHGKGMIIRTPVFTVKSFRGCMLYLLLYPRGNVFCDSYIDCSLRGTNSLLEGFFSNEKIDIISADGEILGSEEFQRGSFSVSCQIMKIDDLIKKMENCKEDTLIVRYYFTAGETKKTTATCYEVKTRIGVDRCSFYWNVANFPPDDWAKSKKYHFRRNALIRFTLTAPEDALLINIQKTEKSFIKVPRFATCRVSLMDVEGVERHSKKYTNFFDCQNDIDTWGLPSFITKTQLNSEACTFLKNGTFTLMCKFSISTGTTDSEIHNVSGVSSSVNVFPPTDSFLSLKEDLRYMFSSKKHSDVKLQVQSGIIPAHKSLLVARSPVFSAMFEQDMLENQTGVVNIPDMEEETLNSFLSFLYTGTVNKMDWEVALKLLLAADKYQVKSLKEKCASFLASDLSGGNACEVLVIADMVGHKLLKESVQDYIKAQADKILPSREWSQWIEKNVRLASEILSKLSVEFRSLADKASIPPRHDISSALNVVSPVDAFSSLKEELRNIFTSKKHSDVKLQVGGDIFPAHKYFLAARSPVFSTMFDQDMLESQTGVVDIPDMDAETLNSFLTFVYTGTVDKKDYEGTLKLLVAADKYQVESLKEKCACFLTSYLSDGNACEVLVVADMVGHQFLKEFVQDYIKAHADKILPSREWPQWIEKNVRLASEILLKLSMQLRRS